MAVASACEVPKHLASKRSAPQTKAPYRMRALITSLKPMATATSSTSCTSQRAAGTTLVASSPVADNWRNRSASFTPAGKVTLAVVTLMTFRAPASCLKMGPPAASCTAGVLSSLKYAASCATDGASKMRLLGSSTSSPTAACS